MKNYYEKITNFYNSESTQKVWRDPVWSKVISALILGAASLAVTAVLAIWNLVSNAYNLDSIIDYVFNYFDNLDIWMNYKFNKTILTFIKVFLCISFIYLIFYVVYSKTRSYWTNLFKEEDTKKPLLVHHPTVYFDYKLASAFPGIRELTWFMNPKDAAHRLEVLLKKPITYTGTGDKQIEASKIDIFWWYRGFSNMYITSFKTIKKGLCLLDDNIELNISKIAIYRSSLRRTSFVYVETSPMQPTGLYDTSGVNKWIENHGYYSESYALLKNRKISINDYNDNATVINGKVISANEAVFRIRYVSTYNFIIASPYSPYCTDYFDKYSNEYFDGVLNGSKMYDELFDFLKTCRERKDDYWRHYDPFSDLPS